MAGGGLRFFSAERFRWNETHPAESSPVPLLGSVTIKLMVLGLAALLGLRSTALADCLDTATKAIEQKGLTVREGTSEALSQPANSGTTSHRAWLRVSGCEENGYVVVNMRPSCGVRDYWTTGGCDVNPKVLSALAIPLGTERR